MSDSYSNQLFTERKEQRISARPWLQCFLAQTPPTYEFCKEHFEEKGILITKKDYEDVCKKMSMKPQYNEKSPSNAGAPKGNKG